MATKLVNVESIGSYFESLSDPRHTRNRKHLLVDIVVIAVCGIVCGCDGPTAIHRWAVESPRLAGAVPHASQRHPLARLHSSPVDGPEARGLPEVLPGLDRPRDPARRQRPGPAHRHRRQDHVGGRTTRRNDLGPLHIVSAWASEEGIALGQVATEEKSNEITAIPQLLEQIDLTDTLITIDAMGCQKEIARDIVDGGGDFVITVKDNQPTLREAIETYFEKHLERDLEDLKYRCHETSDAAHGRIDERSYFLTKIPPDFALKKEWPWIKAIGYSLRVTQHADGQRDRRDAVLHSQPLSQRQAIQRGGPRSLGHRVDALGVGRELPRGRQPHTRANAGQQSELAATLRRDAF